MDVMFNRGPECQKMFKSSISGVTCTDTDDHFNTSSGQWDCLGYYGIACHSWCNAADNSATFWPGGYL